MSWTLSAHISLGIILAALGCPALNAQSQSPANPQTPLIRSTRREVLVDLVVRDGYAGLGGRFVLVLTRRSGVMKYRRGWVRSRWAMPTVRHR